MASTRQLNVAGNIHSEKLPGGNLIAAVLDRHLMSWSDRGKASQHIGDQWSHVCTLELDKWIDTVRADGTGARARITHIVRLDEDDRIAVQAGRHKLRNPDFIVYGQSDTGKRVLFAVDAKFAIDTIKPVQVSSESLKLLLDLESGLAMEAVRETLQHDIGDSVEMQNGLFLSPRSPLTDYYWDRVAGCKSPIVDANQINLLDVSVPQMFGDLPEFDVLLLLEHIDQLPGTNASEDVLTALYYFRAACACTWLWKEAHAPLLSLQKEFEIDYSDVQQTVCAISDSTSTAYALLESWSAETELAHSRREALSQMAKMPVRMGEIRSIFSSLEMPEERRLIRVTRGILEKEFKTMLIDEIGTIPAEPADPFPTILENIGIVTTKLRPVMLGRAVQVAEMLISEQQAAKEVTQQSAKQS